MEERGNGDDSASSLASSIEILHPLASFQSDFRQNFQNHYYKLYEHARERIQSPKQCFPLTPHNLFTITTRQYVQTARRTNSFTLPPTSKSSNHPPFKYSNDIPWTNNGKRCLLYFLYSTRHPFLCPCPSVFPFRCSCYFCCLCCYC